MHTMQVTRSTSPKRSTLRRTSFLATALIAAGLLGACASHAPLPALEQARSTVERTGTDPVVGQYAQIELKDARDTLARADHVWSNERDESEVNHLAYLAQQRAEIASNTARTRQMDAQIQQSGSEADRLRLQARTREADQATQRANMAQQQAMSAEQRAAQQQAAARSAQESARSAQERVGVLEGQLRDLEAQQTERGLLVTLGDVLFAFDKAELSAQAAPRLDKLAGFLTQFPERQMLIEGYTDSVGNDSYNRNLSERRAQAVRDALVQRGVASARITARGYGKAHPVADNGSADGRAMNRRVEIVIADDKGNLRGR